MDRRKVGRRTKFVMKTIGIVAEGPRDFELIAAVVDTITNEENNYQIKLEIVHIKQKERMRN